MPVYRQRKGVVFQRVDQDTVLLDLDSGEYYTVDDVGGRVWELCDGTRSITDVIAILCAEYDAPAEEVHADIESFVEELADEKLLETVPADESG